MPDEVPPFYIAALGMAFSAVNFAVVVYITMSIVSYFWNGHFQVDLEYNFPTIASLFYKMKGAKLPPAPLVDVTKSDLAGATGPTTVVIALTKEGAEQCYRILDRDPTEKLQFYTGHRKAIAAAEMYDLIAIKDEGKQWAGVSLSEPHPPFDEKLTKTYLESWLLKLMVNGTLPWKRCDEAELPVEILA